MTAMKRKKLFVLLATLIAVAAISTTLAFMFKKTSVDNRFVPGTVSCQLYETVDGTEYTDGGVVRQGSTKSDIKVKNTGNISSFIRVRLVSHWTDADGNAVGLPSELPQIDFDAVNWLKGENNTYYYITPVAPGELSGILCEPIILAEKTTADGETVYMVLTVLPEAIQAEPSSAAAEAWGVTITGGEISAVD